MDLLEHSVELRPERLRFGVRVLAYLLDIIILLLILLGILAFLILPILDAWLNDVTLDSEIAATFIPFAVVLICAVTALEVLTGRTPAKFLLGYALGDLNGKSVKRSSIWKRGLVKILLASVCIVAWLNPTYPTLELLYFVTYAVFLLGCCYAFGASRMTLHDRFAGTAVYRIRDLR